MKKSFVLLGILFVLGCPLWAQQFAKTGLVNLPRIYTQFYKESKSIREFEDMKAAIQKEIDKYKEELRVINDQKMDALAKGDNASANKLDQDFQKKQDFLKEFARIKQDQLKAKSESIKNDNAFQKQVVSEIEQEAISKGFSMILNLDNPSIVWYSPDADITDGVISRLTVDFAH